MDDTNENQNPDIQKYEGKGVTLPVGLWEAMAGAYFAESKGRYTLGGSGGETISVPDAIFWKVARAYYGAGFSYRQEYERVVDDTGGSTTEPTTEVKRYKPVPGPTVIPQGNLARIAALHGGLQSNTAETRTGVGGDDSGPHQP